MTTLLHPGEVVDTCFTCKKPKEWGVRCPCKGLRSASEPKVTPDDLKKLCVCGDIRLHHIRYAHRSPGVTICTGCLSRSEAFMTGMAHPICGQFIERIDGKIQQGVYF